jgi:predicted nucleotidyltransferase
MTTEPPPLDINRILDVLKRHEVAFLLVGGVAAIAYGARRPTSDLDCVTRRTEENLNRLAAALRALNARLRVHGLSDEEAAALPTRLDAETLGRMEISTWRTDAGELDVLTDIPSRDGRRLRYADLITRAHTSHIHGVAVQVVALPDLIASKEWANRPKDHEALAELHQLASQGD